MPRDGGVEQGDEALAALDDGVLAQPLVDLGRLAPQPGQHRIVLADGAAEGPDPGEPVRVFQADGQRLGTAHRQPRDGPAAGIHAHPVVGLDQRHDVCQ